MRIIRPSVSATHIYGSGENVMGFTWSVTYKAHTEVVGFWHSNTKRPCSTNMLSIFMTSAACLHVTQSSLMLFHVGHLD